VETTASRRMEQSASSLVVVRVAAGLDESEQRVDHLERRRRGAPIRALRHSARLGRILKDPRRLDRDQEGWVGSGFMKAVRSHTREYDLEVFVPAQNPPQMRPSLLARSAFRRPWWGRHFGGRPGRGVIAGVWLGR